MGWQALCEYAFLDIKCIHKFHRLHSQQLADDHKLLVELACGTTLTAAYSKELFSRVLSDTTSTVNADDEPSPRVDEIEPMKRKTVVFIVCGGVKISVDDMLEYRQLETAVEADREWEVALNGEKIRIPK